MYWIYMYVYYMLPLCLGSLPCVQIYVLLKYFPHTSEYSKFFCRSFIELTVIEERTLKICNVSLQYISKYSSNSPHVLKCCVCNTGASYPPLSMCRMHLTYKIFIRFWFKVVMWRTWRMWRIFHAFWISSCHDEERQNGKCGGGGKIMKGFRIY